MALILAILALSSSLISLVSGSFSIFLPESLPQQYSQQQESSSVYWPDNSQGQEYDDDSAYRYHHSYESSYRQQIQSIPYTTSYPNTYTVQPNSVYQQPSPVFQQVPPSSVQTYQLADPAPLPHASGVLPGRVGTPSLPVYQLVTIGPEVPVLVRLPNQQTAILPVRTVYTLPGFLERIVQRVQNFYSVYNPLEIPRANATQPALEENNAISSTTTASSSTTTAASAIAAGAITSVESDEPAAPATTTAPVEDTTTDSNNISAESTTSE